MPDPAEGQLGHVFGVPFSTLPLPVFFDPIPRFSAGSGEDAVCVCVSCEEVGVWDKKVVVTPLFVRCVFVCVYVGVSALTQLANEKKSVRASLRACFRVGVCGENRQQLPSRSISFFAAKKCLDKPMCVGFDVLGWWNEERVCFPVNFSGALVLLPGTCLGFDPALVCVKCYNTINCHHE